VHESARLDSRTALITGRRILHASQLSVAIDAKSPGDMVKLTYLRDGKTKTATVTLETRPS
jgi:S1-C subfamily serine protease